MPSPSPLSSISACIVNWNTRDELRACLHSLPPAVEAVVVDNASEDGSAAMVRSEFPGARLIANERNENYARGTNQAIDAATGDAILLLNPDVEVTASALETLATALAANPKRAAVAPKLVHGDGRVQRSIRGFPEPGPLLWDILGLARLFPRSRRFGAYRMTFFDYDKPADDVPQPMASCLLIARAALEKIGPMDETFPLFFNDVDWCLRAHRAGFSIAYTPDAVVVHAGGASTKKARVDATWESHRALLRFTKKHAELTPTLRALVTLGAWVRTGRWGRSLAE